MLDKDIREPLFDYIDGVYNKVRILEEIKIRKSVADVMIVTDDKWIGIEIKSDNDTYTRLPSQIKDYNHFFDYNYIAVGKSHKQHVAEHIPKQWGILCIEQNNNGKVVVTKLRDALPNMRTKLKYQIRLMWRLELNNILFINSMPKYKGKSKIFVQEKLCDKISEEKLKTDMCSELFERDYTLLY